MTWFRIKQLLQGVHTKLKLLRKVHLIFIVRTFQTSHPEMTDTLPWLEHNQLLPPTGFRTPTLGLLHRTDPDYSVSAWIIPKTSASRLDFNDLHWNKITNTLQVRRNLFHFDLNCVGPRFSLRDFSVFKRISAKDVRYFRFHIGISRDFLRDSACLTFSHKYF